ncbi:TlpA family protein disulfide reductase [Labilibacter sediminis]|nr:TlpA family protein disulfide reductase [Labilibacter sediminis]
MSNFFSEQWKKYSARKTKAGIVIDFLFLLLFLAMLHPVSRHKISSFVIRYTMTSPKEIKDKQILSDSDYSWHYTNSAKEEKHFSELKGKVILLNFWATWCPPCVAEFPAIQELYNEYGDKIEFVLISSEEQEAINQFLDKKGYTIPTYTLADKIPGILSTNSLPTTFLISKKGEIVLNKKGAAKWNSDKVKSLLDKLIAE